MRTRTVLLVEDALHAMAHAVYVEEEFDDPPPPSRIRPYVFLGPQRRRGAPWLDVMVEIRPPRGMHVFHVMNARRKHVARMEDTDDDD